MSLNPHAHRVNSVVTTLSSARGPRAGSPCLALDPHTSQSPSPPSSASVFPHTRPHSSFSLLCSPFPLCLFAPSLCAPSAPSASRQWPFLCLPPAAALSLPPPPPAPFLSRRCRAALRRPRLISSSSAESRLASPQPAPPLPSPQTHTHTHALSLSHTERRARALTHRVLPLTHS
jgi:hypothetical protein